MRWRVCSPLVTAVLPCNKKPNGLFLLYTRIWESQAARCRYWVLGVGYQAPRSPTPDTNIRTESASECNRWAISAQQLHGRARPQLLARQRRQLLAGSAKLRIAIWRQRLDTQECIGRGRRQLGAIGLSPVPAAADRAHVVVVDHFARQRRFDLGRAECDEMLAAAGALEANLAADGRQILSTARQQVLER